MKTVGTLLQRTVIDNDDLIVSARDGDSQALGQLYDKYYDRIFGYCLYRLFLKESAEDVTSTVFLHVAKHIGNIKDCTEQNFRNWVYTIATNQTNAHIKKMLRRRRLFNSAVKLKLIRISDGYDQANDIEWPRLYEAIMQLKPMHQTVITLRFFEGLQFNEIAQILKTRPVTVRVALGRALDKLRGHLRTSSGESESEPNHV